MRNLSLGDYVFITGYHRFSEEQWKRMYPQNIFGKIIETKQRFSQFDGRKLPKKYTVRCYVKRERYHRELTEKYLKLCTY